MLGGDPILMLSAILPLPEDMDELAFAGFLRGAATEMVRDVGVHSGPGQRRVHPGRGGAGRRAAAGGSVRRSLRPLLEAADFPVFHVRRITHRRRPLYPASVVGKPPQEDKAMGIAVGEMVGPLIRLINPNVVDLYAFENASFHNLLGVS